MSTFCCCSLLLLLMLCHDLWITYTHTHAPISQVHWEWVAVDFFSSVAAVVFSVSFSCFNLHAEVAAHSNCICWLAYLLLSLLLLLFYFLAACCYRPIVCVVFCCCCVLYWCFAIYTHILCEHFTLYTHTLASIMTATCATTTTTHFIVHKYHTNLNLPCHKC